MIARLALLNLGPGAGDIAEDLADKIALLYPSKNGFKSVTFIGDYEFGEYGSFSLWETKEDAEAASEELMPRLSELVGDKLQGPPIIKTFDIYDPKS